MYVCKLSAKEIAEKFDIKSGSEVISMLKNLLVKSINQNPKIIEQYRTIFTEDIENIGY